MGYVTRVPNEPPIDFVGSYKVFVVYILVRLATPQVQSMSGLTPAQNRYLPMAYTLWVLVCMCSKQRSKSTLSLHSITANYSWSYTYEVRVWGSFDNL